MMVCRLLGAVEVSDPEKNEFRFWIFCTMKEIQFNYVPEILSMVISDVNDDFLSNAC